MYLLIGIGAVPVCAEAQCTKDNGDGTITISACASTQRPAEDGAEIAFDGRTVPDDTRAVLVEAAHRAGARRLVVTSTLRTPREQASVMLAMLRRPPPDGGPKAARKLYGPIGDAVVELVMSAAGTRSDAELLSAMADVITTGLERADAAGGRTELMHIATGDVTAVDIDPGALNNVEAFIQALRADPRVRRVIPPGGAERAIHVEVNR